MANIKVSELPSTTSIGDNDYFMLVQSNSNKKVTAKNLNKNLRSEAITVTLANNTTISVSTAYTSVNIPLDTLKNKKDDASIFTFSNNAITVNESGYYLISGNIMANSSNADLTIIGSITRDRSGSTLRLIEGYMAVSAVNKYVTIGLTPVLANLEAGDKIYLNITGSSTESITIGGSSRFTYLTAIKL